MMRNIVILSFCFLSFVIKSQVIKSMKRLPDTGQNTSYTLTFGEDNDFNIDMPYFIDNGDGTVLDTITGLVWQKEDGGEMTIESAFNYCDSLTLGGFSDWRLPTAQEGFSILNMQFVNPSLDVAIFSQSAAEYWWTSEFQWNDPTKVWVTNAGGGIGNHPKSETLSAGGVKHFHARCLRSDITPISLSNHFIENIEGTISDLLTGLIWQKTPFSDSLSWENALSYADTLIVGNRVDWRLPNIKELQSINDETKVNPSLDNSIFASGNAKKIWSSTTLPNSTTRAWYLNTQFGLTTYAEKLLRNYVLCVHSPVESTSSVALAETTDFSIFPNPFTDQINIVSKNGKMYDYVLLTNQLGQKIYAGSKIEQVDLSSLSPGIYFLKINEFNIRIVKR